MTAGHRAAIAAGAVLGLITIILYKAVYFTPDGYIYLQYARNIASGGGWSFNAGETSFGTTSPTWTLVLALAATVARGTTALIWASALLGLVFYSLAVREFALLTLVFAIPRNAAAAATLVFAACPFFGLYQSISAMETGFALFIGLRAIRTALEGKIHPALQGFGEGVFLLTRPEFVLAVPLIILLFPRSSGRVSVQALATRIAVIALTAAPWFLFVHAHTGSIIPTSGNGRLLGLLWSVFPGVPLREYMASSIFSKIALIPVAFQTQFLQHPMMLATVIAPIVVMAVCLPATLRLDAGRRNVLLLGLSFSIANLLLYLIRQPLVFQRYFVLFVPFTLLTMLGWFQLNGGTLRYFSPAILAFVFVISAQYIGFRYYLPHQEETSAELISNLTVLDGVPNCRLAAECLGYAGIFTHCYVIDLGGLIDPGIWPYWVEGRTSDNFARDWRATHYVDDVRTVRVMPADSRHIPDRWPTRL